MLTVAVSSRALFNLEDGHKIWATEGNEAFDAYMRKNEKKPLRPGAAFPLIQKLLNLNRGYHDRDKVEVVLLSSNSLDAGARVMNSCVHHGLDIERAFFTAGASRFKIAQASKVTLFLSTNPDEVRRALEAGIAAASVQPTSNIGEARPDIRIAFDGDSVLFSDEAEQINQREGLAAFHESEQRLAKVPLGAGPFKPVLQALHELQGQYSRGECPIRIALVTARGTPAYERVLKTFRTWKVKVDEALFCAGLPKGPFLDAFGADLFFDDGMHHVLSAAQYVPAGHVPHGVVGRKAAPVEPAQVKVQVQAGGAVHRHFNR